MLPLEERARQEPDAPADRAMLTRRLQSWLASEPAPVDIVEVVYRVARELEAAVLGGLDEVGGRAVLGELCRCLLYCDLDDFLAAWPPARAPRW